MDSVFAEGRTQHARYDTDSRLLELRTSDPSGALVSVETHSWQEGLELRRRVDYSDGRFEQTQWTYDSQRRLLRRVMTGWNVSGQRTVEFTYDNQGRIARVTGSFNTQTLVSVYEYDAQGHLVAINTDGGSCGSEENRCATLSYWSNGQLKRHEWYVGRYDFYVEEYNELGQLIHSTVELSDSGSQSTRAYDAAGRLIRWRSSSSSSTTQRESLTTTLFDPGGWRERFAEEVSRRDPCNGGVCGPDSTTHQRVTRRTTLWCGTQLVALDEWDDSEDGVVDAHRTHERDETGRLVHEETSGTPGLDDGPVRRDFHYVCPTSTQ